MTENASTKKKPRPALPNDIESFSALAMFSFQRGESGFNKAYFLPWPLGRISLRSGALLFEGSRAARILGQRFEQRLLNFNDIRAAEVNGPAIIVHVDLNTVDKRRFWLFGSREYDRIAFILLRRRHRDLVLRTIEAALSA